ncbi:hypothetical protein RHS01_07395 [Rhizoctonia solani]|uniref:Uncharacterized protein n=1 Tax=Rhizoctonia solani TaxID=456999 RepID=A0A8H7M5F8_9AGAM|nr:hypothetical protein RHS01_07395 [Rhizoctonia solani]
MELEVNGLEVVKELQLKGASSVSSSILEELNCYRNAWLKPEFRAPVERPVGHPRVLRWELHNNSYFKAYSSFEPHEYPDTLQIIPLDSMPMAPSVHFHTKFYRFTLDPIQDLAVLVVMIPERSKCVELHIRSLTTGELHAQARRPNLIIEFDFDVSALAHAGFHYAPEVLGSVLAVRFNSKAKRMYEILTWDWRSGILLHRISCENGTGDAHFINSSHIAVFAATIRPTGSRLLRDIALSIYDIGNPVNHNIEAENHYYVSKYPTLNPSMTFNFPKLRDSHSVFLDRIHGKIRPYSRSCSLHSLCLVFPPQSITLGLVLSLFQHPVSQNNLGSIREFRGFVSTSLLLDHLAQSRGSHELPKVLSWDQWGEKATRWFPRKGDNINLLHANGSTTNRPTSPSEDAPTLSDNAVIIMTLGSDVPGTFEVGFEETIVSRLPCRVIIRVKPEAPHDGWLLDGSRLIGIKNYLSEYPTLTVYDLQIPA